MKYVSRERFEAIANSNYIENMEEIKAIQKFGWALDDVVIKNEAFIIRFEHTKEYIGSDMRFTRQIEITKRMYEELDELKFYIVCQAYSSYDDTNSRHYYSTFDMPAGLMDAILTFIRAFTRFLETEE